MYSVYQITVPPGLSCGGLRLVEDIRYAGQLNAVRKRTALTR
jgi:hypothetical protein